MNDRLDLDEIERRAEAATKGPWDLHMVQPDMGGNHQYGLRSLTERGPVGAVGAGSFRMRAQDAEFIAHARSDVPALVAELQEARAEIERLSGNYENAVEHLTDAQGGICELLSERDEARAENERLREELAEWEADADQIAALKRFAVSVADLDRPSQIMRRRRVTLPDLCREARSALAVPSPETPEETTKLSEQKNVYERFIEEVDSLTILASDSPVAVVGALTRAVKRAQMVVDGEIRPVGDREPANPRRDFGGIGA